MSFDITGGGSATGGGNSGSTRTTIVRSPDMASRETVKTTQGDSGNLTTSGHLKQEDGQTSRDGTYGSGNSGDGTVTLSRISNSGAGGTFHFARSHATLTNGTNSNGSGSYTVAAGSGGASSQSGSISATSTAKLDASGTEGSSTRTETPTGASWSGTLTKSSDSGTGRSTKGGSVKIDEDGNVTGEIDESENGSGTQTTSILVYSGTYDRPEDQPHISNSSRRLDTYTTTTKNSPAEGDQPASASSTDTHEWQFESIDKTKHVEYEYTPGGDDYLSTELYREWNTWDLNRSMGTHTSTVTIAGDQASATISMTSSYYEESTEPIEQIWGNIWRERQFYEGSDPEAFEGLELDRRGVETKKTIGEGTDGYTYSSSHQVDEQGHAFGGRFSASSHSRSWSGTVTSSVTAGFGKDYEPDYYVYGTTRSDDSVEGVSVTKDVNESGSYSDWILPGGAVVRVTTGTYTSTTVAEDETKSHEHSDTLWHQGDYSPDGPSERIVDDNRSSEARIVTTTTNGSYGPYGSSERTNWSADYALHTKSDYDKYILEDDSHWYFRTRYDLVTHVDSDGSASGRGRDYYKTNDPYHVQYNRDISFDPFEGQDPPPTPLPPPTIVTAAPRAPGESEDGQEQRPLRTSGKIILPLSPLLAPVAQEPDPWPVINDLDRILRKSDAGGELSNEDKFLASALYNSQQGIELQQRDPTLLLRLAAAGVPIVKRDSGLGFGGSALGSGQLAHPVGLDELQTGLDGLGFSPDPIVGGGADALSGLISLSQGEWMNAILSGVSILPFGDVVKGGKLAVKAVEGAEPVAVGVAKTTVKEIHGNSLKSTRPATLYELYDKQGNFLKHGVTQDINKRYTKGFMTDKRIFPVEMGERAEMLLKERERVMRNPGPLNREPWAGILSE